MPMRTRRVRAAMKLASESGAELTERTGLKWISPSQTPSSPQASAASASSSVSWNAASSVPPGSPLLEEDSEVHGWPDNASVRADCQRRCGRLAACRPRS